MLNIKVQRREVFKGLGVYQGKICKMPRQVSFIENLYGTAKKATMNLI